MQELPGLRGRFEPSSVIASTVSCLRPSAQRCVVSLVSSSPLPPGIVSCRGGMVESPSLVSASQKAHKMWDLPYVRPLDKNKLDCLDTESLDGILGPNFSSVFCIIKHFISFRLILRPSSCA